MAASSIAAYTAISLASLSIGYYLGTRSNPRLAAAAQTPAETLKHVSDTSEPPVKVNEFSLDSDSEEEEDESVADGDLGSVKAGLLEECKLVLIVRTDLGMSKGKIAAQCGHATLACYKALQKENPALLSHWERIGQAKVALRCESEEELMLLQATAQSLNLCARTIRDAGRTQIASGSQTVLGIGPGPVKLINQVTGKLKLL